MLPCHAERRLSTDPDKSITALIFYDHKYMKERTKVEERMWDVTSIHSPE
jgi:hypothetical protein